MAHKHDTIFPALGEPTVILFRKHIRNLPNAPASALPSTKTVAQTVSRQKFKRITSRDVWMLVVLTWMAILALAVVLSKLLQEEKNGDLFGMKVMGDADDDYTFTRDDVVKASNEPPDDSAGDYDYFYYNTSNETDYYFEDKVDDDNNDYYDVNDEPVDNDVYTVNDNISCDNYDDDDSVFQLLLTEADIVEMLLIDGIISKNDEYFGNVNDVERRAINYLANVHYYLKIVLDDETLRRQLVEKFALAVLYYSTGGPRYNKDYEYDKDGPGRPWSKQNNWLEDPHVCNAVQKGLATVIDGNVFEAILDPEFEDLIWEGVECDKEGFVVKVDLKQNILRGTLPTAFSGKALPRLRYLDLSDNELDQILPESIGSFIDLVVLDLSKNKFRGDIPSLYHDLNLGK